MTLLTLNSAADIATDIAGDLQESLDVITDLPTSAKEINVYLKNLLTMLEEFAVTYGGKLIIAVLLMVIGFKLVNLSTKKLEKSKALSRLETSTRSFIRSGISIVVKVIIGMTALAILGIPMSSMIAVIGSCGLAIGLALQGSLANIAGGFIILVFKPFSVGDFIIAGDVSGTVEDIGMFQTKIITTDNKRIIIPNSVISNATLTNASAMKERRVDLTFTASYDADINTVEKILKDTCEAHALVFKDPAPFARLSAHGDSALEYTVRVWCKNEDYWTVHFDLIRDVKYAFDKNGVSIPYPQMDVHTN